jgi:regulator of RNase E activity RraB
MIEYYEQREDEEQSSRIEVDLSLVDNAPDLERAWLLWLFVKVESSEDAAFINFRNDLIDTLYSSLDALYAGTIAKEGWCELYFYAATSKKFENLTADVMARHNSYPYERGSSKDTKWEMYQERLYPEPFEIISIQNRHTIAALLEEGDDLTLPREVEHYFFFQTPTALERFENFMMTYGFTTKEHLNDDESDYAYGITLIKTEAITPEQVHETTSMLYELVMQEHGHYEGWSTVLA